MTLNWTPFAGSTDAWLYLSNSPGAGFGELHYSLEPTGTPSRTVTGLPQLSNGASIYARVYSHLPDRWGVRDYIFTRKLIAGAVLSAPEPDALITSPSVTVAWIGEAPSTANG